MQVYLAGVTTAKEFLLEDDFSFAKRLYMLESFYYFSDWEYEILPFVKGFLLDSGAFTFMAGKHISLKNLNNYVDKYCDFINLNKIEHFFEMDVDCIYGYDTVKKIRSYIERKTKKQCIPVWHKSRGKDEFIGMCKDYDYVSIGGIVTKEIVRSEWRFFPWFIDKAHENNAKIHALGFFHPELIQKCPFDSVDATYWNYGNRWGYIDVISSNGKHQKIKQAGKRLKRKEALRHNFIEWIKYSEWCESFK